MHLLCFARRGGHIISIAREVGKLKIYCWCFNYYSERLAFSSSNECDMMEKCVVGQCSKFRRKPKRHKLQITSFSFQISLEELDGERGRKKNYYGSFFWKADLPRCLRNNAKCATMQSEGVITRVWNLKTFKVEDVVHTFMPLNP